MLELMTAWIVILAATYVRAKHNRAEMPNSNNTLNMFSMLKFGPHTLAGGRDSQPSSRPFIPSQDLANWKTL